MKYLASIFSFIFIILVLELFTRLVIDNGMNYEIEMQKYANNLKKISDNPKVGIEHRRNKNDYLMGAKVILNNNGFRNKTNFKLKGKKILMLGDSMTFGWGAKEPFPNLLNEIYKNNNVINAGIGNTNTYMQIENFFENFKDLFDYEMIVLNFFINDFENIKIKKANFIEKNSYLYTYAFSNINHLLIKYKLSDDWKNFYSKTFYDENSKNKIFDKILILKKYCIKNDIKFVIHNIPELRNLKNYTFSSETILIEKFAKNNDIQFINSLDLLKFYNEESLWVTKKDSHANDKAHKIIADFFVEKFPNY